MKQVKFTAFLMAGLMASTLGLTSCGDDEDEVKPKTKTELLTSAEWKGSDLKIQGQSVKDDPSFQALLGDISTFKVTYKADGNYTASAEGETTTGTWKFVEDESKLMTIDTDQDTTISAITVLSASELVLTETELNMNMSLHYKH